MNDDISRLLHDAAPEGPNPDSWADGARHQSSRRRTLGGVVAAMAAVALMIPVAVSLGGPDTTAVQATPSPTPSGRSEPSPLQPPECLDADGRMVTSTGMPVSPLAEGATRLWLCAETLEWARSSGAYVIVGAPEPLTLGVDKALEAFNALGDIVPKSCPGPRRYQAAVVVEYPNGETVVLGSSDSGCDAIGTRGGWRSYLATLTELWTAQRETLDTRFTRDVRVCPATESLLHPQAEEATRGYACPETFPYDENSFQRALPTDLVGDIAEEISGVSTLREDGWPPDAGPPTLVLLNAYGDPVWLTQTNAEEGNPPEWRWTDGDGAHVWTPSPELAARIDAELMAALPRTATPSDVPVPSSPQPSVPYDVELISYRHTSLASAHPEVFAGWGFSEDFQVAELYYGEKHMEQARELAAEFDSEGALSALVSRRHSWSELLVQRKNVLSVAEKRGIEVIEAVPDPRESDGILLIVARGKLNADGSVGSDADWSALTAAGVVNAEVDSYPVPSEVAGFPVFRDSRSWYNLPLANVDSNGTTASAILQGRTDIYAAAAFSPFYDYLVIWVQQDHLAEARKILVAAGIDMDLIRLASSPYTMSELDAQAMRVWEAAETMRLGLSSVWYSIEDSGVVLGLTDIQELETLTAEQRQQLLDLGLVAVVEQQIATAMPLEVSPEPTPS